ncbi:MAG: hypothetical protein M0R46_09840 [Candidatus Muirbacterium halophilum]|nr:hypothetical protein [Candidatus Muirbacterium halophilum]
MENFQSILPLILIIITIIIFIKLGSSIDKYYSKVSVEPLDLDLQTKIIIPFSVSILGGTHIVFIDDSSFDVKIPAGIKNGEILRVKEKGKSFKNQIGNLFIKVEVARSNEYERKGDDLYTTINIPLKTAFFGGDVQIKYFDEDITLEIPKNIKNNQMIRIESYGANNTKTFKKGDLYLTVSAILPDVESNIIIIKDI